MRFFSQLLFSASLLSLARCVGPSPSDPSSAGKSAELAEETGVYECVSQNAHAKVQACLGSSHRTDKLAKEILESWQPSYGPWHSLMFKTEYIQNKFRLTVLETDCLIQKFCKEK